MRPRTKNRHLPSCVYLSHGKYYLVRGGKWIPLGADLASALAEYARRIETPKGGMGQLIDSALDSMRPRLSRSTQKQYQFAARKLKTIFLHFTPTQVKPVHVVQVKASMVKTPNMANRVLSFLRQVFDYALEQQLVASNPAIGIRRHREQKRKRLPSQEEFDAIYSKAGPRLQVIMDLLFLTGQRINDVLRIKRTDLLESGILFVQQKTGARLIVRWTSELHAVRIRANELCGNVQAFTLLHNRRGKAPDYSTVKIQWDKARTAATVPDVTLHDLRAMSLTTAKRQGKNPRELAGHTTDEQTATYLRDREIPVVDGPSFRRLLGGIA